MGGSRDAGSSRRLLRWGAGGLNCALVVGVGRLDLIRCAGCPAVLGVVVEECCELRLGDGSELDDRGMLLCSHSVVDSSNRFFVVCLVGVVSTGLSALTMLSARVTEAVV